jgi:hypothetical protein
MADETTPGSASEAAEIPTASPVKKQRAPRAKKSDSTVVASASEPAKKNRGGRPTRAESAASVKDAASSSAATSASRGKRAAATATAGKRKLNRAAKAAGAASPLADDLADLLQLEEENQRLRKSLAEKLRAENADLRSRLGLK